MVDGKLPDRARTVIFAAAAACLAGSLTLLVWPGTEVVVEWGSAEHMVRRVDSPRDLTTFSMLLFVAALLLFCWGVNGYRLVRSKR